MKLGLGLYRDSLTDANLRFARQAGATHVVVHLVDYFKGKDPSLARGPDRRGWGVTTDRTLWSYDELKQIKDQIEAHDLTWAAIENFDPAHWHDVLLDGPKKEEQLDDLKTLIRTVGEVGVPVIGYNFSIAGVWGWTRRPAARGSAPTVTYDADAIDPDTPIPEGMVWNMTYDPDAPEGETVGPVSSEQLWQRLEDFLEAVVPVAEEAGVRLAAHPDDPPVDSLRRAARLVNQPHEYQRLLDLEPSRANGLEFCMGSVQEMREGDLYESLEKHARQGDLCYLHARNVRGKVPDYQEVFIDEGDIDMPRALTILEQNGFDGVVIPDHTPEMSCDAPWHAGMAYALGYLRGVLDGMEG